MSKFLDRFRYFKQKGETLPMGTARFWIPTGTGKTVTASAGSMTKSSVRPTA